ncbi:Aspartate carbamoyltransferase 2, chloroplastic-like protein, partial [Drosera capensis]
MTGHDIRFTQPSPGPITTREAEEYPMTYQTRGNSPSFPSDPQTKQTRPKGLPFPLLRRQAGGKPESSRESGNTIPSPPPPSLSQLSRHYITRIQGMSRLITRSPGKMNSSNSSSCKCFGSSSRIVVCEGLGWFSARWECVKPVQRLWNNNTEERNRLQSCAVEADKGHLFEAGNKFQLEDVIEAQQFDRETLSAIFDVAREMEKIEKNSPGSQILKGYLMATLFYEPSTRTRLSFESAMKRLGGEVLTTENAREFSSAAKGETLEDSIRTVEGYADIISGAAKRAAATAKIPVINAGDGPGQHPTQALLDVYTIEREIRKLDGITVGLVGDLSNGRTVRSLAYLLAKYNDVKIYFVAPDVVKMKDDIKDYLISMNVKWEESSDLMEVASKCDVVYQ